MNLTIENVPSIAGDMLQQLAPDGVTVKYQPQIERRGLDMNVDIDVQLVVDVAKVSSHVLAAWLVQKVGRFAGAKLNVNGKQVVIDAGKIEQALDENEAQKTQPERLPER